MVYLQLTIVTLVTKLVFTGGSYVASGTFLKVRYVLREHTLRVTRAYERYALFLFIRSVGFLSN